MGWHRVRENRRRTDLHQLYTLDTEAVRIYRDRVTELQVLDFGVCRRERKGSQKKPHVVEELVFTRPEELWAWVDRTAVRNARNIMIAHNAAYDMRLVNPAILVREHGWKLGFAAIEDHPFLLRFHKEFSPGKQTTLIILSTTNIAPVPLASLAKTVGMEKWELPAEDAPFEERVRYCRHDVEILHTWFLTYVRWLEENDLGQLSPTAPSQALHAFRHRFMKHEIVTHDDKPVLALEREAYHGGRTECFFIGTREGERITKLDVNSMYPYVMKHFAYPCRLVMYTETPSMRELERALISHAVIADVTVRTEEPVYAVRTRERLIFPVGEFRTVLTTPELHRAIYAGHLVAVHRMAVYEQGKLFTAFVDFFYAERLKARERGDEAGAFLCKLMLNSFYGKFGQRTPVWELAGDAPPDQMEWWTEVDIDTGEEEQHRIFLGRHERTTGEYLETGLFVAIAAHVTAYARLVLWSYVTRAGREHVFYVDTDSLIVDDEGRRRLEPFIDPAALGKLKVEGETDSFAVEGLKVYRFGSEQKMRGIRRDAERLEDGRYRQWHWASFKVQVKLGEEGYVRLQQVTKRVSGPYEKGMVGPDGWVRPLRLPQGNA